MNPAFKNNETRSVEYKKLVQRSQQISQEITDAINQVNDLMTWTTASVDVEHLAVAALDNARQFMAEAADHLQHSANMYSGGSAYRINRRVSAPSEPAAPAAPISAPQEDNVVK